jgi:hypothetical protein
MTAAASKGAPGTVRSGARISEFARLADVALRADLVRAIVEISWRKLRASAVT